MTIKAFDSLEDMFDAMAEDQAVADSSVQGWQKTLDPGSYFIRTSPAVPGVAIYCEVVAPDGEDADTYKEEHMVNYRWCRAYSVMCPEGEYGDVHISVAERRITKEEFNAAKLAGWR